jgi:hypothetical protein
MALENEPAQCRERDRLRVQGELGPLPRRPGIAILDIFGGRHRFPVAPGHHRKHRGDQPMTAMVTARIPGKRE